MSDQILEALQELKEGQGRLEEKVDRLGAVEAKLDVLTNDFGRFYGVFHDFRKETKEHRLLTDRKLEAIIASLELLAKRDGNNDGPRLASAR